MNFDDLNQFIINLFKSNLINLIQFCFILNIKEILLFIKFIHHFKLNFINLYLNLLKFQFLPLLFPNLIFLFILLLPI
jgi:hypothetical protein